MVNNINCTVANFLVEPSSETIRHPSRFSFGAWHVNFVNLIENSDYGAWPGNFVNFFELKEESFDQAEVFLHPLFSGHHAHVAGQEQFHGV